MEKGKKNKDMNLEVVDTIDRRRNKRYYPNHMYVEIIGYSMKDRLEVDDISVEGIKLFNPGFSPYVESQRVKLIIPGVEEEIEGEVKTNVKGKLRVLFPRNVALQTMLEANFESSKMLA